MEVGAIGGIGADGQGVLEERDRLGVRAERRRPFGCSAQRHSRLGRQRVGLGPVGRVAVGGQVVAGQGAGQLVGLERLEEPCRGQVADLAVALGQRVVGDLADERLDERVLATLG